MPRGVARGHATPRGVARSVRCMKTASDGAAKMDSRTQCSRPRPDHFEAKVKAKAKPHRVRGQGQGHTILTG